MNGAINSSRITKDKPELLSTFPTVQEWFANSCDNRQTIIMKWIPQEFRPEEQASKGQKTLEESVGKGKVTKSTSPLLTRSPRVSSASVTNSINSIHITSSSMITSSSGSGGRQVHLEDDVDDDAPLVPPIARKSDTGHHAVNGPTTSVALSIAWMEGKLQSSSLYPMARYFGEGMKLPTNVPKKSKLTDSHIAMETDRRGSTRTVKKTSAFTLSKHHDKQVETNALLCPKSVPSAQLAREDQVVRSSEVEDKSREIVRPRSPFHSKAISEHKCSKRDAMRLSSSYHYGSTFNLPVGGP